jgi:hypothetical protein
MTVTSVASVTGPDVPAIEKLDDTGPGGLTGSSEQAVGANRHPTAKAVVATRRRPPANRSSAAANAAMPRTLGRGIPQSEGLGASKITTEAAPVPTVSVDVAVPVPGVTWEGENAQELPAGNAPAQDSVTGWSKLGPFAATLTVKEALWPEVRLTVSGAAAIVKPDAVTHAENSDVLP